jgi:hypothetical protein
VARLDLFSSLKFGFTRENHISAMGIVKLVQRNLEKYRGQGRRHGTSWGFNQIFPTYLARLHFSLYLKRSS